jgi:hypothetical protein
MAVNDISKTIMVSWSNEQHHVYTPDNNCAYTRMLLATFCRDEQLMSQGLALNDDLQRVLAKHDAIAAGIAVRVEKKPKSLQALVDTEDSANQDANKDKEKEKGLIDIEDPTSQDSKNEPNQRFAPITSANS